MLQNYSRTKGVAPLRAKFFYISCSFWEKSGKFVRCPPPAGEMAPPPTGNPGSAPVQSS